jgi:uncharacterized protein YcbK (DUF882 family)
MKLMTQEDWKEIKHFSPNENWGDWTKMAKNLFLALDKFREYVGHPVYVNCGYATNGHTNKSYHYKGMAVDIHVKNVNVIDQFLAAERIDEFNGIGLYPDWRNPGLHLDIRPKNQKFEKDSRWLAIRLNGKQTYIALNSVNIKKFCL